MTTRDGEAVARETMRTCEHCGLDQNGYQNNCLRCGRLLPEIDDE